MIEGAVIMLIGVVVGRFLPSRRRKFKEDIKGPICGCGHHASLHAGNTGSCHGGFTEMGHRPIATIAYSTLACKCQQYTGPVPMIDYYAPEIGA